MQNGREWDNIADSSKHYFEEVSTYGSFRKKFAANLAEYYQPLHFNSLQLHPIKDVEIIVFGSSFARNLFDRSIASNFSGKPLFDISTAAILVKICFITTLDIKKYF